MVGNVISQNIDKSRTLNDIDLVSPGTSGAYFSDIMSKSMAKQLNKQLNTSAKSDVVQKTETKLSVSSKTEIGKISENSVKSESKIDTKSEYDNGIKDADKTKEVSEVDDESDDDTKKTLGDYIRDYIKSQLNLSDEEINAAMQSLGLTYIDLLKTDNVAKLVLEVSGNQNPMSLLTDEFYSNALKNIIGFVEDVNTVLKENPQNVDDMLDSFADLNSAVDMNVDRNINADALSENISDKDNATENESMDDIAGITADTISPKASEQENQSEEENVLDDLENVLKSKIVTETKNDSSAKNENHQHNPGEHSLNGEGANIAQNLAQSIHQTFQDVAINTTDAQINTSNLIRQIIDSVKIMNSQTAQSMEIQLNPQNLGKLSINVLARNGQVTAEIIVQNEQVKKALETQMVSLKENLESQGIKVDAVEITYASHGFESNQSFSGNNKENEKNGKVLRKNLKLDGFEEMDEESDRDDDVSKTVIGNGNSSVEFSA